MRLFNNWTSVAERRLEDNAEISVCLRMRGGDPRVDAVDGIEQRLVRINATINSTQTWALEAQQPHLLEVAEDAKA
eukprot:5569621-Prorocentrum_lima.AAC.1